MSASFPHLFTPLSLRGHEIRNRILSTGHQTWLAEAGRPGDALIAYHETRARGGVGLIVNEAARFHASGIGESKDLALTEDAAIPHYARLATAVHRHGAKIFGQLSHSGRMRSAPYRCSQACIGHFHSRQPDFLHPEPGGRAWCSLPRRPARRALKVLIAGAGPRA